MIDRTLLARRTGGAWRRLRSCVSFGGAALVLVGACTDGALDLDAREVSQGRTASAGGSGTAGAGNGGFSGEVALAGEGGADTGKSTLLGPDFCAAGVGECFYAAGELSCEGYVGETALTVVTGTRARLLVDMTNAIALKLAFRICDPSGYVMNVGDSPTDNGGGGDWGQFQHDAEIMIYEADLSAWASDLGYQQTGPNTGYHPMLFSQSGYVAETGCSVRTLLLRDQIIADADDPGLRADSLHALRINPGTDAQGSPDARWYIGVNRVVSDHFRDLDRVGQGVEALRLCFYVPPPAEPPRTGPPPR
jgi:hypothetical protein